MTTFVVFALALSALLIFYVAVRSRRMLASGRVRPVDLKAFRTVTDRDDELFLRERLPYARFRRLKRQRIGVAWRYLNRIASNAAAVMRLGEAARQSPDPEVAQTAAQVLDLAGQIRLQCLLAYAKLTVEFAVPSLQLTPAVLAPQYQTLRENVVRLGRLQAAGAAPLPVAI
ncbi:MAG TPA: hypothetical protein VFL42_04700 [Terriglobales bacterium]|nr:hypothetical protein [Terriglobales bacterium]